MSRAKKTPREDHAQKLKEAFAILTQGVEMIHYETSRSTKRLTKLKKIVWMDSDILRLCVDVSRPTLADRAKGKIPPGIYMRDIAEIRRGNDSFDFLESFGPHATAGSPSSSSSSSSSSRIPLDDNCLSLIATERTISLELPLKFAREWFYERLVLVAEDILTAEEKEDCNRRRINYHNHSLNGEISPSIDSAAGDHLLEVLNRGIQVLHHHPSGLIYRSILSLLQDEYTNNNNYTNARLNLKAVDRTFFGFSVAAPMGMKLSDVVEIRPGTHSFGFVGTKSTDKHQECLSIIGSESTLDIQLTNSRARDVFGQQLRNLLLYIHSLQPPSIGY